MQEDGMMREYNNRLFGSFLYIFVAVPLVFLVSPEYVSRKGTTEDGNDINSLLSKRPAPIACLLCCLPSHLLPGSSS